MGAYTSETIAYNAVGQKSANKTRFKHVIEDNFVLFLLTVI